MRRRGKKEARGDEKSLPLAFRDPLEGDGEREKKPSHLASERDQVTFLLLQYHTHTYYVV